MDNIASLTFIKRVAVLDKFPSLISTVKLFVPTSISLGVPDSAPLGDILSQAGPDILLNVIESSFVSLASFAIDSVSLLSR